MSLILRDLVISSFVILPCIYLIFITIIMIIFIIIIIIRTPRRRNLDVKDRDLEIEKGQAGLP